MITHAIKTEKIITFDCCIKGRIKNKLIIATIILVSKNVSKNVTKKLK